MDKGPGDPNRCLEIRRRLVNICSFWDKDDGTEEIYRCTYAGWDMPLRVSVVENHGFVRTDSGLAVGGAH